MNHHRGGQEQQHQHHHPHAAEEPIVDADTAAGLAAVVGDDDDYVTAGAAVAAAGMDASAWNDVAIATHHEEHHHHHHHHHHHTHHPGHHEHVDPVVAHRTIGSTNKTALVTNYATLPVGAQPSSVAASALDEAATAAAAAAAAAAAVVVGGAEDEDDVSNKWSKNGFGATVVRQSGKFSKEESELVRKSVEDYCAFKNISTARLCSECDHKAELKGAWMEIAKRLPHRSVQSVYRHGIRQLHPFKRGAWNDAECATLMELVARLGKKWATIQGKLHRSADSCRDKYREMSEDFIKGRWKDHETEILKGLIREQVGAPPDMDMKQISIMVEDQGIQIPWSTISKRMGKRSRLSCFKKWQKLTMMYGPGGEEEDLTHALSTDHGHSPPQPHGGGAMGTSAVLHDPQRMVAGSHKRIRLKAEDESDAKRMKRYAQAPTAGAAAALAAAAGGDEDDDAAVVFSAKMADETVQAVGLPDTDALDRV